MANKGKFKALDHDLQTRLEIIKNLASEFELYLILVQHEANEFGDTSKYGEKVCEQMIKTEVIDVVTQISKKHLKNIEKTIESIESTFEILK